MIRLLHPPHPLVNTPAGNWDWNSAHRDHFNLWVCFEGTGTLTVNDASFSVSPGFAILLLPEEKVTGQKEPQDRLVNMGLHFLKEKDDRLLNFSHPMERAVQLRNVVLLRELATYLDRRVFLQDVQRDEEAGRVAEVILDVYFSDRSLGFEDPVDLRIHECASNIRLHADREWSVPELAHSVGLSVSQFNRRFRKCYECSPIEFLLQCKMDRARILLQESTLSISQLAEELGYRDVGYFSRQFKKRTGVSPLGFRNL